MTTTTPTLTFGKWLREARETAGGDLLDVQLGRSAVWEGCGDGVDEPICQHEPCAWCGRNIPVSE